MRNIKLVIEYDGTNYHGWQVQPHAVTIQEILEEKLATMTRERIHLTASGRTDAGVHALGQVANFRTSSSIPLEGFLRGLNSLLPADIVIKSAEEVEADFHAQLGAKGKTYRYVILNGPMPSALHRHTAWHVPHPLDLQRMERASHYLLGKQNFASFRAADADSSDPVREVFRAGWSVPEPPFLHFIIEANGFLKHMVRNIVGTLVEVGKRRISEEDFEVILAARDRRRAGMTAPAQGLFLVEVRYGSAAACHPPTRMV
jgi:tRNA pseudouridine38-40 synthase